MAAVQTGPQKGDKGDTGAQGPKGDTGATGSQGDTGTSGMRAGTVSLSVQSSKAVTFSSPLANTNYRVSLIPTSTLTVALGLWITNKTVNGFTINSLIAITATFDYTAVPDM